MAENKFFRMTTKQLVASKDHGAKAELRRRGRDAEGRRGGAARKPKKVTAAGSRRGRKSGSRANKK